MLKIIHEDKEPKILVITPLLTGHTISKDTKNSIKRNEIPYIWVSYTGDGKHAKNVQNGLDTFINKYPIPKYIQILDRDIILGRFFLDRMYEALVNTKEDIGFTYCPFEYRGFINIQFPPQKYDIERLLVGNYISSNSLYKTEVINKVKGFVVQEIYHRLSDWAMFLKLYYYGYIGTLCDKTQFTAVSTKDDISAGSREEFEKTAKLIRIDFGRPIIER